MIWLPCRQYHDSSSTSAFRGHLYFSLQSPERHSPGQRPNPGSRISRWFPVFVLGSEDHDYEEVQHIRLLGKPWLGI